MEIIGYLAAVLIGISLGLIGGGGSILTVPVLVYLMHINPLLATTYSLFIVGTSSLVGGVKAYTNNMVDFRAVTEFGIPSIFSVFIARHFILPAIPESLFFIRGFEITRNIFLMVFFAVLMLAASISMIKGREEPEESIHKNNRRGRLLPTVILGLAVGAITGILGAGGGFLIIPTLIFFIRLDMKTAIGSSLLIIAINSLFGFLFSLKQFTYDWKLLVIFTALAISGVFIGSKLGEKIPGEKLKRVFGWFVLVMGVYIIVKEIFLK